MSTLDHQPNDLLADQVFPAYLALSTGVGKYRRKKSFKETWMNKRNVFIFLFLKYTIKKKAKIVS